MQGAGSEANQLGQDLVPKQDAGNTGGGLTCSQPLKVCILSLVEAMKPRILKKPKSFPKNDNSINERQGLSMKHGHAIQAIIIIVYLFLLIKI